MVSNGGVWVLCTSVAYLCGVVHNVFPLEICIIVKWLCPWDPGGGNQGKAVCNAKRADYDASASRCSTVLSKSDGAMSDGTD